MAKRRVVSFIIEFVSAKILRTIETIEDTQR